MNREQKIREIVNSLVITIDGPAGSGKSTTASLLAERLELTYLDTGAMYRAVTYAVLRRGIDPEDEVAVSAVAGEINVEFRKIDSMPVIFLDGKNVENEIRRPDVSENVSPVSRYVKVREAMVRLQRRVGKRGGVVVEGRDTGSIVFPYAQVKIFLTANIKERVKRRQRQLRAMGVEQCIDDIKDNILQRDAIDSGRANSPLLRPPGSTVVDTSELSIDGQVDAIETLIRKEAERLAERKLSKGEHDPFGKMRLYYRISHILVRSVFKLIFGLKISGEENLLYRESFIFASNHLSYADPLIVGCALNREVWFLAKKELFRNRLFAWLIRTYHAIPVDRDEIDRKTLKIVLDTLKSGESVLMFPEGTRSRNGDLHPLKDGLGFIALLSRISVVPVYVTGSNSLLGCALRRKKLEVRIGPPIRIDRAYIQEDKKRDYRLLGSMIFEELRMLKRETEA